MELCILKMIFFIHSFGVLLNCSIYYYYYFFFFINFFRLLAFNFSYIKYASPLPHHRKCALPSPGPVIFFLNFGYTLHHRIFTAILTCSTIKTLPSGSPKKKKKKKKPSSVKDDFFLSSFFFFFG